MEVECRKVQVACLCNIPDLQRACQKVNLKFSQETNEYLLYLMLKKLGPWMAQKLIHKLVEHGEIEWNSDDDFEVETILDHAEEDGVTYYFIKWRGWPLSYNTWEPEENLNCPEILEAYKENLNKPSKRKREADSDDDQSYSKRRKLQDLFSKISKNRTISPLKLLRISQSPTKGKGLSRVQSAMTKHSKPHKPRRGGQTYSKNSKWYKQRKADIQKALKDWERELNAKNTDPAPILVENDVDLEGPPDNFIFIDDYKAGEGVIIPQDPIVGCECTDCADEKKKCCPANSGASHPYHPSSGRLRVPPGTPIYECNKRCACPPECPNRVVQHGRKFKVSIFRTHNGRGWGVKTKQKIKKGSFVMEYVGEVITNEEAEKRGRVYDAEGRTYLFDLDYNDGDCPYTVDAGFYGNVSHFVNHSCDPNLAVYGVWINTLDPRLPRICLFAKRDIAKGEELTFDYMMTGDTSQQAQPSCALPTADDILETTVTEEGSEIITMCASPGSLYPSEGAEDPVPATETFRMVCQCGAKNCRKYLF
ncbi:histone-lysine N-methyltransferase SUV39H1-A [Lingula anatina]|uniref:Histone-lysine N-methyltransferase n=1 Tax=Lingula anatina TaxID=7574 RepID=A0A1S3I793_LINAN|nr:histone-lysine N-methyltransferase SUV39H1-A [Lingula anatina]|eukprot:XP_013394122.1 histone-lysine N-methyltransferase SUV39H1-A [Lingula anatina]